MTKRKRLKGEERREQILRAGLTLFTERGLEGVTMADLAEATGMSRPNVYTYFSSPGAVLEQLLDDALEAANAELLPLLRGEPDLAELLGVLGQHRSLLRLLHCGGGPDLRARREHFGETLTGPLLKCLGGEQVQRRPELVPLLTGLLSGLIYEEMVRERPGGDATQLGPALGAFVRGGVREVLKLDAQ